jgi:RNA polymerase sigma-70 factor (ECF subfamily)
MDAAGRTMSGLIEPSVAWDHLYRVKRPTGRRRRTPMRAGLVERARDGDDAAFTELVDLDGDRCYAIAYRIMRDVERAQDAVQQAYLLAWRELPRLRDPERYSPWLQRLLVNACYEELRRHRRWSSRIRSLPVDGPGGPDPMVSIDDRDALDRAFVRLTPEHRAVFVLHHHTGLPLADIAEIVGAPVGTVKSRLHHATRLLRAAIVADNQVETAEARPA